MKDPSVADHAAGVRLNSFDYYQETDMAFTVEARMLYDNYRGVDVLNELRNRMSWNGFDPGRVAPSINVPPSPSPASANCGSYYGDSALLIHVSELTVAIAGPWSKIGDVPSDYPNDIPCYNGASDSMISVPVWHSQPTFVDSHSQKTYADPGDLAIFAKNFYSEMWNFLQYRGLTANYVVFGETNPVDNAGCDEWRYQQADAMLNGIPGYNNGYKNSTLYASDSSAVLFCPWHTASTIQRAARPVPM